MLEIYNENDELIANNSFGYLDQKFVNSESSFECTFIFPAVTVSIKDDNLSIVKAISKFSTLY